MTRAKTKPKMSAKGEALAFRIWAYASPRGWNCTLREIADELNESINRVRGVLVIKGWIRRTRMNSDPAGGIDTKLGTRYGGGALSLEVLEQEQEVLGRV